MAGQFKRINGLFLPVALCVLGLLAGCASGGSGDIIKPPPMPEPVSRDVDTLESFTLSEVDELGQPLDEPLLPLRLRAMARFPLDVDPETAFIGAGQPYSDPRAIVICDGVPGESFNIQLSYDPELMHPILVEIDERLIKHSEHLLDSDTPGLIRLSVAMIEPGTFEHPTDAPSWYVPSWLVLRAYFLAGPAEAQ